MVALVICVGFGFVGGWLFLSDLLAVIGCGLPCLLLRYGCGFCVGVTC